jgi:hypothetical protein
MRAHGWVRRNIALVLLRTLACVSHAVALHLAKSQGLIKREQIAIVVKAWHAKRRDDKWYVQDL